MTTSPANSASCRVCWPCPVSNGFASGPRGGAADNPAAAAHVCLCNATRITPAFFLPRENRQGLRVNSLPGKFSRISATKYTVVSRLVRTRG